MSAFIIGFFWLIVAFIIALFDSDHVATFSALCRSYRKARDGA